MSRGENGKTGGKGRPRRRLMRIGKRELISVGMGFKPAPTNADSVHGLPGSFRRIELPWLTLVLMVAITLTFACGGSSASDSVQPAGQVRGVVVEVVGRSITEIETLRIRDDTGNLWTFDAGEGFIGFSPSHLREHQVLGETVLVTYESLDGRFVAVDISD